MTFLDDEHEAFAGSARRFLTADGGDVRARFATAGENGFLGIAVPEEFGGAGVDDLRFGIVLAREAMSAGAAALGLRLGLHGWVAAPVLVRHASAEQRAAWLPGVVTGRLIATVTGLHPQHAVHGEPDGDGLRLTGTAVGVLGAAGADLLLVAVTVGDGERVAVVDLGPVGAEAVGDELGLPGAGTADIVLDGLAVPASAVLPAGDAGETLRSGHDLWLAVLAVAGARAALDETLRYVVDRKVFGRPLAEFENTRRALAEVDVELAAAQALVEDCVRARSGAGLPSARAAAAAVAGSAVHARAVDQGLQLHGGYGYMREYPIAQAFADARRLRLEAVRGMSAHESVAAALGI